MLNVVVSFFRVICVAAIGVAGFCCEALLVEARAATEVRSEPGGTRFMVVEGLEVRLAPGGARISHRRERDPRRPRPSARPLSRRRQRPLGAGWPAHRVLRRQHAAPVRPAARSCW